MQDSIQKAQQLIAQSPTSGLDVDLEHLTTFYNSLAQLHSELLATIGALQPRVDSASATQAGGQVRGLSAAWTAIVHSSSQSQTSMMARLRDVDARVQSHMAAVSNTVSKYTDQEIEATRAVNRVAVGDGTNLPDL